MDHARAFEPIQDGRIYIEKINYPFIDIDRASPAEYRSELNRAIERGWLGTVAREQDFHPDDQAGKDLFA
jgi:hypothetical protein